MCTKFIHRIHHASTSFAVVDSDGLTNLQTLLCLD